MKKLILISLALIVALALFVEGQTKILSGGGGAGTGSGSIATTSNALVGDNAGGAVAASGTGTDCLLVNGSSAACGTVYAGGLTNTIEVTGQAIDVTDGVFGEIAGANDFTGQNTFTKLRIPSSGTPPATDCDAAGEYGNLYNDNDAASGQKLYLCTASGWELQGGSSTPLASPYRVYTINPVSWVCTAGTVAGANRIRGYYFNVENDMSAATLSAMLGTAGGASTEWAFGLYDTAGTRICQSGAISASGGNAETDASCSANITKGTYIIAWGGENTTMKFCGLALGGTVGGFFFGAGGAPFGAVDFPVGDAFSDTTGLPATLDVGGATRIGDVTVLGAMLH